MSEQNQPPAGPPNEPPAGPPPAGPPSQPQVSGLPDSAGGFFKRLFDVRFSAYITPSVVTVLYVLGMVGIALGYLSYVVIAFNTNVGFGIVTLLILGPIFSIFALIWLRVILEFYLALIRLSGDFRDFRAEWRQRA